MTPIRVNGDIYVFGGGGDMMTQDKHTEVWRVSIYMIYELPEIQVLHTVCAAYTIFNNFKNIFSINETDLSLERSK